MSGPVCPVCGAAWGTCGGHPSWAEIGVRALARSLVTLGLLLIGVGVLTLIM